MTVSRLPCACIKLTTISYLRCGACRQFTPELASFFKQLRRHQRRKNNEDPFAMIWISRCRDVESSAQYFTQMPGFLALPFQSAVGQLGASLSAKFSVKAIPTWILLDENARVINKDPRKQLMSDRSGVGFPWRNPIARFYMLLVPRSLRKVIRAQWE